MPENKTFTVTEIREVRVTANSALVAAQIAQIAFTDGHTQNTSTLAAVEKTLPEEWGYTSGDIRQKSIRANESYS